MHVCAYCTMLCYAVTEVFPNLRQIANGHYDETIYVSAYYTSFATLAVHTSYVYQAV
jgi:hypothetical protein